MPVLPRSSGFPTEPIVLDPVLFPPSPGGRDGFIPMKLSTSPLLFEPVAAFVPSRVPLLGRGAAEVLVPCWPDSWLREPISTMSDPPTLADDFVDGAKSGVGSFR